MHSQSPPGVILLTQNLSIADLSSVREWFEGSDYDLCEAADVFQAIERLSDFTEPCRPDVVLLEGDCTGAEFAIIRELSARADGGREPSVFSFGAAESKEDEIPMTESISTRLDSIFQDMSVFH